MARGIAGARAGPGTNEDGDEEEEYYRSRTGTFPVRWTSPEAMQTMRFSEASDVWSFAVTLIEIFTDGGKPYVGMANAAVISQVQAGYRAEQPTLCSDKVYVIMLECWSAKPADRPPFAKLVSMLEDSVSASSSVLTLMTTPAVAASSAPISRQAVAVNDTYMTDEPAAAAHNSVGVTVGEVNREANDEYLSVAAGLGGSDEDEFQC